MTDVMFRRAFGIAGFVAAASISVALVALRARRDSADPARCARLVPQGTRCCAPGQRLEADRCVGRPESCPPPLRVFDAGCVGRPERIRIPGGTLHAGAGDWEAEGRVRPHDAAIAVFDIDALEITEAGYGECVQAKRCAPAPLSGEPGRALSGITRSEVEAFCAFRGGRLPTEDEWTWAAGGPKSRRYPWGDTGAVCRRAAFGLADGPCAFGAKGPELAGAHPDGSTPDGILDLAGNVAEWVAGTAGGEGRTRGGSWATSFAVELRSWQAHTLAADARSAEVGGRCVYDVRDGAQ